MEFVVSLLSVVSPSKGNVAVYRGQSATAATAAASVIPAVGSNMAVVHHFAGLQSCALQHRSAWTIWQSEGERKSSSQGGLNTDTAASTIASDANDFECAHRSSIAHSARAYQSIDSGSTGAQSAASLAVCLCLQRRERERET